MTIPTIIIPGFGQSKAKRNNSGNTETVWPLSVDLKAVVKEITPSYIKTVICRKDKGFTDKAYSLFCDVFEPFTSDNDGNPKYDIIPVGYNCPVSECSEKFRCFISKIAPVKKLAEETGYENIYYFAYNPFITPYDTAAQLKNFIEIVKEQKKCDKVNLICYSMAGAVATAYFERYADKKSVDKTIFIAACLEGSAIQKSIMEKDVDKKEGYSLLGFATDNSTVGTFKRVLSLTTWDVRYNLLYRSLDAVKDAVLITGCGMWALLPHDCAEAQKNILLTDEKYCKLREKIDAFINAQKNIRSILTSAEDKGTSLYFIAAYGNRIMSLCNDKGLNTDGILDISSTTLGATASHRDEYLKKGERLSPDKKIDLSTAFRPEKTWCITNTNHNSIVRLPVINNLVYDILTDKTKSVNNDYPQFL